MNNPYTDQWPTSHNNSERGQRQGQGEDPTNQPQPQPQHHQAPLIEPSVSPSSNFSDDDFFLQGLAADIPSPNQDERLRHDFRLNPPELPYSYNTSGQQQESGFHYMQQTNPNLQQQTSAMMPPIPLPPPMPPQQHLNRAPMGYTPTPFVPLSQVKGLSSPYGGFLEAGGGPGDMNLADDPFFRTVQTLELEHGQFWPSMSGEHRNQMAQGNPSSLQPSLPPQKPMFISHPGSGLHHQPPPGPTPGGGGEGGYYPNQLPLSRGNSETLPPPYPLSRESSLGSRTSELLASIPDIPGPLFSHQSSGNLPQHAPHFSRGYSTPNMPSMPSRPVTIKMQSSPDRPPPGPPGYQRSFSTTSASGGGPSRGGGGGGGPKDAIPSGLQRSFSSMSSASTTSLENMLQREPPENLSKTEYRRQSIQRWLEKRKRRKAERKIEYSERSVLANRRQRVSGRFVKQTKTFVSITELPGHQAKPGEIKIEDSGGGGEATIPSRSTPQGSVGELHSVSDIQEEEEDKS